jgi:6-phosphofructokinase 1
LSGQAAIAGWNVWHKDGYEGLCTVSSSHRRHDVSLLSSTGQCLRSLRCEDYKPNGRARGAAALKSFNIDGLVAIGGDGTLGGARHCTGTARHVLVPATIGNDVLPTGASASTAVNGRGSFDRLRDTAEATEKVFFVEVMGRNSGALALHAGLAAGADAVLIPERPADVDEIGAVLKQAILRRSRSLIVIVAEGHKAGNAFAIAEKVGPQIKRESRVTVLGHVQRGGVPTARDRVLASRLGIAAVDALMSGKTAHRERRRYGRPPSQT